MVKGILKKYEPLESGEVTITIKCPPDVDMHKVVDLRGEEVAILPAQQQLPEDRATVLGEIRSVAALLQAMVEKEMGVKQEER